MHCQSVPAGKWFLAFIILFVPVLLSAQGNIKWAKNSNGYYRLEQGELSLYTLPQNEKQPSSQKAS